MGLLWHLGAARVLALAAALAGAGCASFDQEVDLAPFYWRMSTAGGGERVEALAGAVVVERPAPDAPVGRWALRPLLSHTVEPDGGSLTRFLVPLGRREVEGPERVLQLLPVARYQETVDPHGHLEWKLFALPGIIWSRDAHGRVLRAVFPFGGVVERFLTFDRIVFVLFPLYAKTERGGRVSHHVLWPVFNYARGGDRPSSWRLWPLYGRSRGLAHDRRFVLWPLFHHHENQLHEPPPLRERRWMFFPFYGRTHHETYDAWTWLWPFFGYARDTQSGFRAWDGPWPLVRVQRPGTESDAARRTRVWPFYSRFEGDGLVSRWYGWPVFNLRTETHPHATRRGSVFVPFWQRWVERDEEERRTGSWLKLWPLVQERVDGQDERLAFLALNPLWPMPVIDFHYAWIWELYVREREGRSAAGGGAVLTHERSWGGIWRRESGPLERRSYLCGLWSRRAWAEDGSVVRETSLCFGLVRWKSRAGAGTSLLAPAFPGPGWPLRRGPPAER